MDVHKKYELFDTVYTNTRMMQRAYPAEPIFLTQTLLMEGLAGDAGRGAIDHLPDLCRHDYDNFLICIFRGRKTVFFSVFSFLKRY